MDYRREIDGLRALAVLPVILFHAGFQMFGGGFVGVDVFFVISGYLITTMISSELEQGKFSIVDFYERRARRILPALFLVMLTCIPFAWFLLLPNDMKLFGKSLVAVSLFSSNVLFWRESGYFAPAAELNPLLHTWSLAVEEQYYLLFPLFLMLAWPFGKRWVLGTLAIAAVVSLAAAQFGSAAAPAAAFFLLPTRGWELLTGAFVALYLHSASGWQPSRALREIGGAIGLAMLAYSVFAFSKQTPFPSAYALLPTVGTALIILFVTTETTVGKFVGNKLFVGVGLISYSAYLWHQPLFAFARHLSLEEPSTSLLSVLAAAAVALAYFSWKYVETPFRSKRSFSRKQVFAIASTVSIAFLSLGSIGYISNGFDARYAGALSPVLNAKDDGRLEGCFEDEPKASGYTCHIGDVGKRAKIAIIGDSHATRITAGFSDLLKKHGLSAVVYAQSWCPPLLDVATENPAKYPICREYRKNTLRDLVQNDEIGVVFMIAEWSNYTKGYRGVEAGVTYYTDSHTENAGPAENVEVVKRGFLRTVKTLTEAGKKLVVVKTVPEYGRAVPYVMAKSYIINGTFEIGRYKQTQESYRRRNLEFLDILQDEYLASNVSFIDTENIYCRNVTCEYQSVRNEPFYIDGNHLTRLGSEILVKQLMDHVK